MKNKLSFSINPEFISYKTSLFFTLLIYCAIYSIFLIATHGLPYVFDNNETFSSLIHAQNIFHFGVKETFGLTDESNSLTAAAHPFIYTHQGNFPRFYTLLLYVLGIRTPEFQIVMTTFTIGLAGMVLCHRFFAKSISNLFALIVCLLLMTDYLLFAQWNVNTWRVWHLFFFFSSFLCSQKILDKNWQRFIPLLLINFICLFYTEIVYAVFVSFSCGFYLLSLQAKFSRKLIALALMGLGGLLGIGILALQNIAYLGWSSFLKDLIYTYTARNNTVNTTKAVVQFYHDHHLVFWENFNEMRDIRHFRVMLQNFYDGCLLTYSPFITLSTIIAFFSAFTGLCALKLNNIFVASGRFSQNVLYILLGLFYLLCGFFFVSSMTSATLNNSLSKVLVSMFLLNCLIIVLLNWLTYTNWRIDSFSSVKYVQNYLDKINFLAMVSLVCNLTFLVILIRPKLISSFSLRVFPLMVILFVGGFYLIFSKKSRFLIHLLIKTNIMTLINYLLCLFCLSLSLLSVEWSFDKFFAYLIPGHWYLMLYCVLLSWLFFNAVNESFGGSQKTSLFMSFTLNTSFILIMIMGYLLSQLSLNAGEISAIINHHTLSALKGSSQIFVIIGILLLVNNPTSYLKGDDLIYFRQLVGFLGAAALGFFVAYELFPGYVRTGYFVRSCCFTVFAHIGLYAWLFYSLASKSLRILKFKQIVSTIEKVISVSAFLLLIIFGMLWCHLQYYYIREFPATSFTFINLLSKTPYYHQSLISNTYATPFAYMTQKWGYYDQEFSRSQYNTSLQSLNIKQDYRYLWYADLMNPSYLKPSYFICWVGYSFSHLGQPKPMCQDLPFIQYVRKAQNTPMYGQEVMHDPSKQDRWTIVKLS